MPLAAPVTSASLPVRERVISVSSRSHLRYGANERTRVSLVSGEGPRAPASEPVRGSGGQRLRGDN
jgi:hypothetical protein